MEDGSEFISVPEMKRFVIDCFIAVGVPRAHSEIMSECIVGADSIGHHSHGVYRLNKFIDDVQNAGVDINTLPKIEKETSATAWVNGRNALGPIVGNFCIKMAIAKARRVGAAIVVANNSNNFGVASHYSKQALQVGLIGLAFTNSSATMLPNRAKYPITGSNPISAGAPGLYDDFFLLDMATTVASAGNIEIKRKNNEFLPDGWAANAACIPETNGDVAVNTGRYLPLGSFEESGSYKGTGLSIMVDILCGILAAAAYSDIVSGWKRTSSSRRANIGHCFIVIDPNYFAPGFEIRMNDFLTSIRNAESQDPNKPLRVAGDKKRRIDVIISEYGGILYPKYIIDNLRNLSERFKIKCVSYIPKPEVLRLTSSEELLAALLEAERLAAEAQDEIEFTTERNLSIIENKISESKISFIVEDSCDWLCPFSDQNEEKKRLQDLVEKKRREMLMMKEKIFKGKSDSPPIPASNKKDVPTFVKLDEIMET